MPHEPSSLSTHLNLPQMRLHSESDIKNVSAEKGNAEHLVQAHKLTQDKLMTQRG